MHKQNYFPSLIFKFSQHTSMQNRTATTPPSALCLFQLLALNRFISPPASLAANQVRDEHDDDEPTKTGANNNWNQVADGVFRAPFS